MKQSFGRQKQFSKTTLVGYILAALLAAQPFVDKAADLSKREEVIRYSVKLLSAVVFALLGKYAAGAEAKASKRKLRHGK